MRRVGGLLAATLGLILALPFSAAGVELPGAGLAESNGMVSVGAPALPLVGMDINGFAVTAEMFKGRPVLVDFGSRFCVSCQETLKDLARLEKACRG